MKTAIMTDTNSAITVDDGKRMGIFVMPMPVIIGEENYTEGVDITFSEIWNALVTGKDVSTSQPAIGELMARWDEILKSGYDEIVYIPMSSGLSGSCGSAMAAAIDFDGKVKVVDNHRVSYTLMNSVFDAMSMAEAGMDGETIRDELNRRAYESSIYIAVDSVKNLVKSGRITPMGARIADALHLKPVLQIHGDKLDAYAKVRGTKSAQAKVVEAIRHDLEGDFKDVPREQLSIGTAGSLKTKEDEEAWRRYIADAFPGFKVYYRPLSCSLACHIGINGMGAAITKVSYDQDKYGKFLS